MDKPAKKPATLEEKLASLPIEDLEALTFHARWSGKRHKHQVPPKGNWTIWLLLAGRGAGKTRTAAEWTWWNAYQNESTRRLVSAPTAADVRDTCFEGDSGLISIMPEKIINYTTTLPHNYTT